MAGGERTLVDGLRIPRGRTLVGKTLGHYEIIERLGGGGMGDVYAAHDTRLNREVAIKILPAEFAARADRRERFEREAKTVASLNHPNIVTIHSVEEADGHPFIVMEIVRGRTLGELIPASGMSLEQFFRVALPLADAIHAAHMRGVSHRDLKPNNVMVGEDGRVKVLDFGLAKVMQPDTDPDGVTRARTDNLTAEGRILGTVAYMSPEQAEGKALDHRSDLFSLGILLYEMLTGVRPFVGDTDISVLSSILKDEPRPLNDVRGELPLGLQRIIGRALEKSPDRRYQSAADLRRDLEDLKRDMDTGELRAAAAPPAGRAAVLRRWPAIGLAALVVAALAWLLSGGTPPPAPPANPATAGAEGDAAAAEDSGARPTPVGAPLPRTDSRPSVAVFYFDNLSGDEELSWLRTGLTDMLVTQLSQSPRLRVLGTDRLYQLLEGLGARDSSPTSFDVVSAVAQQAGITTAVLGSFLRDDERLRISARVQDVRDARVLWSETVEGDVDDSILDLVDDLAERVRSTFEPARPPATETRVADAQPQELRTVTTDNLDAWKHYNAALRLEEQGGPQAAIPELEAALQADPDFATAEAKLSELHAALGDAEMSTEYASRAMENAERLPTQEKMFLEGRIRIADPDELDAGIQALQQTVETFPEHRAARVDLAGALLAQNRVDEAIRQLEQIRDLGEMDVRSASLLARAYGMAGDVERGRQVLADYLGEHPGEAGASRAWASFAFNWNGSDLSKSIVDEVSRAMAGAPGIASMRWTALVIQDAWDQARGAAEQMAGADDAEARWEGQRRLAALDLYRGRADDAVERLRAGLEDLPADEPLGLGARAEAAELLLPVPRPRDVLAIVGEDSSGPAPSAHTALDVQRIAAVAARQAGDSAAAESHANAFRQLLARAPLPGGLKGREVRRLEGQLAAAAGDFQSAARLLAQVVDAGAPGASPAPGPGRAVVAPGSPRADVTSTYLLARALWELDRHEDAARYFRRVVDAGADRALAPIPYARSLYYLARQLDETGDEQAAARYYRRFVELREDGSLDEELVREARGTLERSSPR